MILMFSYLKFDWFFKETGYLFMLLDWLTHIAQGPK